LARIASTLSGSNTAPSTNCDKILPRILSIGHP
jgi:hypothetical protein